MPNDEGFSGHGLSTTRSNEEEGADFEDQAEQLGQFKPSEESGDAGSTQAIKAKFITPLDPIIETKDGGRLPVIPVEEAKKLNDLKEGCRTEASSTTNTHLPRNGTIENGQPREQQSEQTDAPLRDAIPPSKTNPLFPPLPIYGPPSRLRVVQCYHFRATAAVLSFGFLLVIICGAILNAVRRGVANTIQRSDLKASKSSRPFYEEEMKRREERRAAEKAWTSKQAQEGTQTPSGEQGEDVPQDSQFVATEGGPDQLCFDVRYYARRVGLDAETFEAQTEDGFILELWHLFDPREHKQLTRDPDLVGFAEKTDDVMSWTKSRIAITSTQY